MLGDQTTSVEKQSDVNQIRHVETEHVASHSEVAGKSKPSNNVQSRNAKVDKQNKQVSTKDKQSKSTFLKILRKMQPVTLEDGISWKNFFAFVVSCYWTIGLVVYLNTMQPYLLTDLYEVESEVLGRVTGTLGLVDEVWSVLCLGFWGVLSDRFGRRVIATLGYLQCALSLALLPLGTDVYSHLLPIRLLYAQGAAALTTLLTSLLADYVHSSDRGKGAAIVGVSSGLGAITIVFVFVGIVPQALCIANTYYLASGVTVLVAMVAWFGLDNERIEGEDHLIKLIKDGYNYTKDHPRIGVAYYSGFLARSGSILTSSFITLWIAKYYVDNDQCGAHSDGFNTTTSTCGEILSNPDKLSCPEAFSTGSSLTGIVQVIGLLTVPIVGYLVDRVQNYDKSFAWMAAFGAVSYFSAVSVKDPSAKFVLGLGALWGTSQLGMVMLSQVMITRHMPEHLRGTISGCYSLIGGFGVMVCTYVGGHLFDAWNSFAPFVLNGSLNVIGVVIAVLVLRYGGEFIPPNEQDEKEEQMVSSGSGDDDSV